MATHQEKVTAGLFLLLGIALIMAVLFLIAGIRVTRGTDAYFIVFEGSIGNLKRGSPVKFMGVPVGTVGDLRLTENLDSIKVELDLIKGTRITSGTRAKLRFSPLTSVYFIELGVTKGALGEDLSPGGVIVCEKTEVDEFVSELPELKDSVQKLIREVADLLSRENQKNFSLTLKELGSLLEQVNNDYPRIRDDLFQVIDALRDSMENFDATLGEFRATAVGMKTDARDALVRGADSVEDGMGQFSLLLSDLDLKTELAETREVLIQVIEQYEGAAVQMEGLLEENRDSLKRLVAGLEVLTRRLRNVVEKIDQDPSRLIWSTPDPERDTPD